MEKSKKTWMEVIQKIWMLKVLMKTYNSIRLSGEGWSMCSIHCNSFFGSCSLYQILEIKGLVVIVVVVCVDLKSHIIPNTSVINIPCPKSYLLSHFLGLYPYLRPKNKYFVHELVDKDLCIWRNIFFWFVTISWKQICLVFFRLIDYLKKKNEICFLCTILTATCYVNPSNSRLWYSS